MLDFADFEIVQAIDFKGNGAPDWIRTSDHPFGGQSGT